MPVTRARAAGRNQDDDALRALPRPRLREVARRPRCAGRPRAADAAGRRSAAQAGNLAAAEEACARRAGDQPERSVGAQPPRDDRARGRKARAGPRHAGARSRGAAGRCRPRLQSRVAVPGRQGHGGRAQIRVACRVARARRRQVPRPGRRASGDPMSTSPRNAFYAQSGGVTAVINASAAGVIETAAAHTGHIGKVYAGRNGIIGALTEDLIDTSQESPAAIAALRYTPAGAFGSCRYKLKGLEQSSAQYERLIEVFRAHDIGYFFYNGGNDSADTCLKVSQIAEKLGYPLRAIHVPKTVDNDLPDHRQLPGLRLGREVRGDVDARSGLRRRVDGEDVDQDLRARSHGPSRGMDHGRRRHGRRRGHAHPAAAALPRDSVRRSEVPRAGRGQDEGVRLLLHRRVGRPAGCARAISWRRQERRTRSDTRSLAASARASRRSSRSTSSTSTTGRWPITCSAQRAISHRRRTSSSRTRSARPRSRWPSRDAMRSCRRSRACRTNRTSGRSPKRRSTASPTSRRCCRAISSRPTATGSPTRRAPICVP